MGVAVLVVGGAGWLRRDGDRATPAPPRSSLSEMSRDTFLAYARGLDFVTVDGAADTRRLEPSCSACSAGPLVTIQPERGSYGVPRKELARGRVIARWIDQDSLAAPTLGLSPHDTTYWWVDSVGGRWRTVLISTRASQAPIVDGLELVKHEGFEWRQALARVLPTGGWGSCNGVCCKERALGYHSGAMP